MVAAHFAKHILRQGGASLKMNTGKIAAIAVLVLCAGAFAFIAFADIAVPQKEISREIPHDRFLKD